MHINGGDKGQTTATFEEGHEFHGHVYHFEGGIHVRTTFEKGHINHGTTFVQGHEDV